MDDRAAISSRPVPEITPLTAPFWLAARRRRLVIQHCQECDAWQFPPAPECTYCTSSRLAWTPASGRATLYSWTVAYPPLLPYFAERSPWPVAAVQLDEGPRLVTRLVDLPIEAYAIGMALVADYEESDDQVTLVGFRQADPQQKSA